MAVRRLMAVLSVLSAVSLAACSSSSPEQQSGAPPSGLGSSAELKPDTAIKGAYAYRAPDLNQASLKYRRLMIDTVVVYTGPEAAFGDYTTAEQQQFAQIIGDEFRKVLGAKYVLTTAPAPDVARIHTTLIGVSRTVGGVATATRVIPVGLAINAVRGTAGASGTLTGAIELAVETRDSQSGALLASDVRGMTPPIYDVAATFSTADTVRSTAHEAARQISEGIGRRAPQMTRNQ